MKLHMISHNFIHDKYSTCNQICPYFEWCYTPCGDYSFYIDKDVTMGIRQQNNGKKKFLWTLESPYFNGDVFKFIKNNLDIVLEVYEMIFTYSTELLSLHSKFKFVPANGTWIKSIYIRPKTRLVSMITSSKKITPLHKFRYNYAHTHQNKIDIYGKGFKPIKYKEEGLDDYMFTICIENADIDDYFTEKILDAFATGTIPIYKGSKSINNYFDKNGILFLDEIDLNLLSNELYYSKIEAVRYNMEKVKMFKCPEIYMWNEYLYSYLFENG